MTFASPSRIFTIAVALCATSLAWQQSQTEPPPPVDFTRDIQPILEKSCYSCHGPKSQMGRLRLDSKKLALAGGQSGKSLVPGHAADSLLYQRIAGIGEQARMPMGGKPLDAKQLAAFRSWIDNGAVWPEDASNPAAELKKHWAFIAPVRPALPDVQDKSWAVSPIDRFILARLDREGLKPSPEADRVTLLRRASLDLIGLPPTIEEVEAFLADKSPDAFAKQVDRLLRSPHYGERWGRQWLDAARYADSDGFEKDKARQAWFYRDWVINAFNRDLPYDRFIIEQIAGDLLPNATQDQRVATGFLRNSMINEEGGVDPEQFRMEAMFDRIDAIGKGMLGVTIQCAQCHNHKFDPLTQEEYYRIFAFLNNSHEANIAVYTPAEEKLRQDIFRQMRAFESEVKRRNPDWKTRVAAWEKQVSSGQPEWTVVRPEVDDISNGGQKYLPMDDGSLLAAGYAPTKHRVKMTVKVDAANITAFRLELLNDPNLPLGGPGRSIYGTAALTQFDVTAAPADQPEKAVPVKIASATADLALPEKPLDPIYDDKSGKRRVVGPIEYAIDGKDETAWSTDAGPVIRNRPRNAVFVAAEPVGSAGGTVLTFYLKQNHGGWNSDDNQNHNLGRIRLSYTTAPNAVADTVPPDVRRILAIPAVKRSPEQTDAVFSHWMTTVPEWKQQIDALWQKHPAGSSQLVLAEREQRRPTHILSRGDFLKPGKEVQPGVPSFLHSLDEKGPVTRLSFAKWLADRRSPTTARAFVNRVWLAYFGEGLVATPEDLGTQAERPANQELLDWLAVEFMDSGWSMKKLHRLIVTSATYRQSSKVTPELLTKDPYNKLLARGSRMRVEAEVVRDITLAASGLLNETVGGPSVFPPAPDFLFQPPASYGPKNWYEDKGENRYRRALYTFRFRSVPYPMLQTFDAPNGDTACVRRSKSNTPLQALVSLNEPLFLESARALALRTLEEGGGSDEQRLTYAFRRVLARQPSQPEKQELLSFLAKQAGRLKEGWLSAPDLAGLNKTKKLPAGVTPVQVAAWTTVARTLLNLDEAITKE